VHPDRIGHPARLWLVRHAESAGNVADAAATAAGHHELDLPHRDMDVPLSPLGVRQAAALGARLRALEDTGEPHDVVFCSPYRRALDTARIAYEAAGVPVPPMVCDERLREREFGVLDRLTTTGIEARFPEQAAARAFLGKFWHRPPGGESWADIATRVRGLFTDLRLDHSGQRVLVVAHQAVIMVWRYVLDAMTEHQVLAADRADALVNTSVTTYAGDGRSRPRAVAVNDASHLPPELRSAAPDVPVAPR
jgi:broad specificity phosphatase PhoE